MALYEKRIEQLTLKAPFEGTVVDIPPWLKPGQWVTPSERLGTLVSDNYIVTVYVHETDLALIASGDKGSFEPHGKWDERFGLEVVSIDTSATRELPYGELASTNGGAIGVTMGRDERLIPETAIYRVICRITGDTSLPRQSLTGNVIIKGKSRSMLSRVWQNSLAIIVRESGI